MTLLVSGNAVEEFEPTLTYSIALAIPNQIISNNYPTSTMLDSVCADMLYLGVTKRGAVHYGPLAL